MQQESLVKKVIEEIDNGIYTATRIKHVPADDSPEAQAAADRAFCEGSSFDWVTTAEGRKQTLAWVDRLFVASGGAALRDAQTKITSLIKSPRRTKRKAGIRISDFEPDIQEKIRVAMRERDQLKEAIHSEAADEAIYARSYIKQLIENPENVEYAFRAGWHLARAQALFRAKAARHGKTFLNAGKGKRPGRSVEHLQEAVFKAFDRFREFRPDSPREQFPNWLSVGQNGEEFGLSVFEDSDCNFKIRITYGDKTIERPWGTIRNWLSKARK